MIATFPFSSATGRERYAILVGAVTSTKDCWAEWLESMRSDGDPEVLRANLEHVTSLRERVLDNAGPIEGETLLDVGCGEGLIAFGALDRGAATVIFSDISLDLLDFCREAAAGLDVLDRCRFLVAPADRLAGIDNESIDVVTTRSVLIYVRDKQAAFHEFARVLRPGGRISLFEPINRFAQVEDRFWGFDLSAIPEIVAKLRASYDAIQPPGTDPMLDFDERDLVSHAEQAGFHPIRLQLETEIRPSEQTAWESFLGRAGNPRIPPIGEVLDEALTARERDQLAEALRPQVEAGRGTWRMSSAFLQAFKPEAAGLH
jgi:ubiquinone/menaquinone biosynthesis C-methylase UbiE